MISAWWMKCSETIELHVNNANSRPPAIFNPGLWGNCFAKSMLPKEQLNKMKAFKSMDPADSSLGLPVSDKFIRQQE